MRNHLSLIILILLLSLIACSNSDSDIEYSDATIEKIQVEKVWELNGGSLPIEQSFYKVGDLEVDTKGNIYVADFSDRRIKKFSPDGEFITTIGRPGQGPGEFGGTFFMELDAHDNIYVRDGVNGRISKFSSGGKYIKSLKAHYIGSFNDFEITGEKIYFSNKSGSGNMLVVTDTTLSFIKEILPIPRRIKKDFKRVSFSLSSFTILPNSNFLFFNSITKKFYEITSNGELLCEYEIKYRKLKELILKNEKIQEDRIRKRRKNSNVVIRNIARVPVFPNINTFGDYVYAMYNKFNKFGDGWESEDILYKMDKKGNFLKEITGFKNSRKFFTIDNHDYIYAVEWFEAKVCKYKI